MKNGKRCAALLLALIMLLPLVGCGETNGAEERMALTVCIGDGPDTFDPIYATEVEDMTVIAHLYENLLRAERDENGEVTLVPGVAKSYEQELNHDGTVTWTFELEDGRWSDGKEVRAEDFVYAWRRLANPASGSPFAALLSIVEGYDEVRATGDTTLLQVSAVKDDTLQVVLDGNYDWFLTEVCTATAAVPLREDIVVTLRDAAVERNRLQEEATGKPGTERWWSDTELLVTNGPYLVDSYEKNTALELQPFHRYHDTEDLPAPLVFHFAKTAEHAQALYREGSVDLIAPLTDEAVAERMAEEGWQPVYELNTYAAIFNCDCPPFTDPLVRKAMAMAVDRSAVAAAAGVTAVTATGIVPPGVPGSEEGDFRTISSVKTDNDPDTYGDRCEMARVLLADAGYDSGAYLGQLEMIHLDTPALTAAMAVLAQQWADALGVQVTPVPLSFEDMRAAVRAGEYTMLGAALRAVGNDAECFLMQWTTGSGSNMAHYGNSAYDTLLTIIAGVAGGTGRTGCLQDAEVLLMGDNAMIPLYHTVVEWTLREELTGAWRDARGWFWLGDVAPRPQM